jgi:hypothetical protein
MAVLHPLYCPDVTPFLFWKLKLALKGRRCDFSTIQEQSPVVCIANSGEGGRDRALKECPLYRSEYGCWSAKSFETSVYVFYMHLECSWTW